MENLFVDAHHKNLCVIAMIGSIILEIFKIIVNLIVSLMHMAHK